MDIQNRRYTGSKFKLMPWIKSLILDNCKTHDSLFDVFGGTGIVSASMIDVCQKIYINDFLYSNEIIYKAFFSKESYSQAILDDYKNYFSSIDRTSLKDNYVSLNFGGKYFNYEDSKLIGYIRDQIDFDFKSGKLSSHEFTILLASLLYSLDRAANTVGHYEAYIKKTSPRSSFVFDLIVPISSSCDVKIFRSDSNSLARRISADIAFIDPPYNSRQYSRFYHVLETITKWDKPVLSGVALKPPEENMSEYCRSKASLVFEDLVKNLNVKYLAVTYNNTYDSKSSSSHNKISLDQIQNILMGIGKTSVFSKSYRRFNAGKTDASDHKEYLFITKAK